ncbi:class I SAM-dependent methyltransferase [Sneathiella sp.]|uniref:class I SAM-dependent methyltransferase n=1 Tax=Sneathiella sp. TaxID=1964365 RepID=UPI0026335E1E|nr:class I SAM-dependent methyltransferase [Sneathiella sp.]MDF2367224.1 class I SAM-dependent methyltransferase [Sneathiella sp.]
MHGETERKLAEATALQKRGDKDAAAAIYRQILKKERKIAPAHYNLALLLKEQGKWLAAEKSFRAAIAADPAYALGWRGLARFLAERNKPREAVRTALKLASHDDFSPSSLQELADLLELVPVGDLGPAGDEAMLRCLNSDEVESDRFILTLLARIRRQRGIIKMLDGTGGLAGLEGALNEPVIAAAFSRLILPSPELTTLIEKARAQLLQETWEMAQELMALIALQLALTEYALETPPGTPPKPTALEPALRAALYGPLEADVAMKLLTQEEAQLATRPWCRLLLTRMGPQTLREREIAAALPRLSASGDAVSGAVQAQYEESPYPRWRELRSGGETTLPALLKRLFPSITAPMPAESPTVLIAGCGTGRHALRTARRIIGATVTAIDLSRSSLAYGARQAEALDIQNVTFAQADLVDLPDSLGRFDLIEACGVLHHMADPEAAWRGLTKFLAPNGVMKVALYSESARQDVIAVREMVGERMETLSLDNIRSFRKELLALPEDHPAASVTKALDFYSLSGCRDFLFHRHEQRFDIPRIAAAIDDLGLEFLGFEFADPKVMTAYRARHGDDPSGRNLANWQAIEAENPALFRGMYQFWCRAQK